eukprot:TRINITY_DN9419_c0_g1_i2.p1 TRINITY_DN9419_c0_g1~~TRINITY_DN9419_c0_g1_i2.p1  ORF type:complete len:230 (-),score=1.54 TRINITY_DN9419_c0_g1_i2:302-919(-)
MLFIVLLGSSQVYSQGYPYCIDCELVVNSLTGFMVNPLFERSLESFLDTKVCTQLPNGQYQQSCDQFIKQFVPSLFNYLAQKLNAVIVCQDVDLCGNASVPTLKDFTIQYDVEPLTYGNVTYCEYCETAVLAVKTYIMDASSKLETYLNDVCYFLPVGAESCHLVVQDYISKIIVQIEQKFLVPQTVCNNLGFCPATTAVQFAVV